MRDQIKDFRRYFQDYVNLVSNYIKHRVTMLEINRRRNIMICAVHN